MIRDEIRRAFAENPAKAIAAFVAAVLSVPVIGFLYTFLVVTLRAWGFR